MFLHRFISVFLLVLHFFSGVFVGQPFVPCAAALFSAFCLHIKMREMCAGAMVKVYGVVNYMRGIVLDEIRTPWLCSRSGPTY